MAKKKEAKKSTKKAKPKKISSKKLTPAQREERAVVRELSKEQDLDSHILDEDLQKQWHRIEKEDEDREPTGRKNPKAFYSHFVMRCKQCKEEFNHDKESHHPADQLICPSCNTVHRVRVDATDHHFDVCFPESVQVVRDLSKSGKGE